MSHSPPTPDKAGMKHPSKPAVPSIDKLTSTFKVKQTPLYEPSPASTYGDTAAGSSPPATPQEVGGHDPMTGLMNSLGAAQIDPAIETISGSPVTGRDGKYYQRSEQSSARAALGEAYLSPSKARSICNNNRNASTNSSPTTDRVKNIRESPTWRNLDATFVRQSGHQVDDPFISNSSVARSPGHVSDQSFHPREDRAGVPLSNDNAQALLPPSACVFVANLMQTESDDQLEHNVHNAFMQFGACYVKIRRDAQGMPFAFVQYENVNDAQRGITLGRGMLINGRPCRTEVAKVNRSLYLSKVTGGPITETEARNLLVRYGPIQKVWYCSQTDKEMFRLPEGIWVMYAFFQDCRDAQAGLRDHPAYRLEQPPMPDDIRARTGGRSYQSIVSPMQRRSPGRIYSSPQAQVRRAAQDLCSIFVGNLPPNAVEEQLHIMFQMYGRILHIEIVRKPSVNVAGTNTFAFIEYLTPDQAVAAINASPRMYQGYRLRVERKESTDPFARRINFISSGGSPQTPYFSDSHDAMALLFQRGVSIGMTQAAQTQVMAPPVYAPYPYYQSYDPSQYAQFVAPAGPVDNTTAASLQSHGNGYITQPMSQFQYPQTTAPYVQYAQHAPRTYQWPPVNASNENDSTSPATGTHETR